MHYRNGREAHNGDKIVMLGGNGSQIVAIGILHDAKPGNSHCNGMIAPVLGGTVSYACLCDCLHFDDLSALIAATGLDKRPPGM